jgi:hypothetical protein
MHFSFRNLLIRIEGGGAQGLLEKLKVLNVTLLCVWMSGFWFYQTSYHTFAFDSNLKVKD